ncbi:ubiquinol-cytochrome c reductase iron-sulfur subunit [Falsiroseomonas selenitidurans]|uniref:Ubiquinol-cytochrome c reductase iron-sulfur subunit n=1 Tax=Falsiroseomonas selenitidurans TaxID=2716335 RepID=A0ABX1E477_9PROT|nr:ubiquinol-cytochrome c reductase iron-sulfur subunit [Falsiroseomonas selenitidurans]NKC31981.1 ubiquinol-cytochrome c reductase iron-sulfur subunit [Falsiroseomonas selenitidurans]
MAETMVPAGAPHGAAHGPTPDGGTRRDFLVLTTGAFAAVGVGAVVWPFISSMNPARDVLALASTEVDLTPIAVGQAVTVVWRGKPVFVRHRTAEEIQVARATPLSELKDPQPDQARVQKDQWLVVLGVCTHLGCVPLGQKPTDAKGNYNGWFCPCHGSHYDTSGRIRQGPAPLNLAVPAYSFMSDTQIRIG